MVKSKVNWISFVLFEILLVKKSGTSRCYGQGTECYDGPEVTLFKHTFMCVTQKEFLKIVFFPYEHVSQI